MVHGRYVLGVVLPITFGLAVSACASSDSSADRERERIANESAATRSAYEDDLAWLDRVYGACQEEIDRTGKCVIAWQNEPGARTQSIVIEANGISTANWRERARAFSQAVALVAREGACRLLAPLSDAQNPYFIAGASVQGSAITGVTGNVEMVYDLRRRQAVVVAGGGVTLGSQIGVGANGYVGFAFGKCENEEKKARGEDSNIVDAYTGQVCGAEVSVSTPFDLLSVGAQAFTSADGCMQGATLGVGVGWSPDPLPVEGGVSITTSGAWDAGTEALARTGWGGRSVQGTEGDKYVQFDSGRAMALHFVSTMGINGILPAATAMALEQLDRRGLTIEQMCPNEVADYQNAKETVMGSLCPDLTPPPSSSTPPSGPTPTIPADAGPPIQASSPTVIQAFDSCAGKEDGIYCSELAEFSAIICKDQSIVGGMQCPNGAKCLGPNGSGGTLQCEGQPPQTGEDDGGTTLPSDCSDKSDGWWCQYNVPGYMVKCQGGSIASGCVCAACSQGGTPAPCTCPY